MLMNALLPRVNVASQTLLLALTISPIDCKVLRVGLARGHNPNLVLIWLKANLVRLPGTSSRFLQDKICVSAVRWHKLTD